MILLSTTSTANSLALAPQKNGTPSVSEPTRRHRTNGGGALLDAAPEDRMPLMGTTLSADKGRGGRQLRGRRWARRAPVPGRTHRTRAYSKVNVRSEFSHLTYRDQLYHVR